jgi:2-dehydropantoate 2-reductase
MSTNVAPPKPLGRKPSIAILSPGGVGGFLAGLFSHHGSDVTCVAREKTLKQIQSSGMILESALLGRIHFVPKLTDRLDFEPDVLIIATKNYGLEAAAKMIPRKMVLQSIIIPLLNGLEHIHKLREHFGNRVVGASLGNIETYRLSPTLIKHTTRFEPKIELGSDVEIPERSLHELAEFLRRNRILTEIFPSTAEVLWRKIARINAIACTTAAARQRLGFIRSELAWIKDMEACVHEACTVAIHEGVRIDPAQILKQIDALPDSLSTSIQKDVAEGNPSELDAIAGAILRAARRASISCPTIKRLHDRIALRTSRLDLRAGVGASDKERKSS